MVLGGGCFFRDCWRGKSGRRRKNKKGEKEAKNRGEGILAGEFFFMRWRSFEERSFWLVFF